MKIVYFFVFFASSCALFFAWRHVARVVFEQKGTDQLAQTCYSLWVTLVNIFLVFNQGSTRDGKNQAPLGTEHHPDLFFGLKLVFLDITSVENK